MNGRRLWLLGLLLLTLSCNKSEPAAPTINFEYVQLGEITDDAVDEISGLAASKINKNVLWVINDSGDDAVIYALTTAGELLTSIDVKGADNVDWEDLASFSLDDVSYLLIADTGGNTSDREIFDLYIVREPNISDESLQKVSVQWHIRFTYEDEPRDCEAVAVDAAAQKIVLLSKRDVPAVLYELPLQPDDEITAARRLGEVTTIPQPTPDEIRGRYDQYHAQPTGMDAADDKIAVLTYRRLFIYEKTENENWLTALNKTPIQIEFPHLEQAEAVCFNNDGASLLITSEQIPAPILQILPSYKKGGSTVN